VTAIAPFLANNAEFDANSYSTASAGDNAAPFARPQPREPIGGARVGCIDGDALEIAMTARRITLRVQPCVPFGEVIMVPAALSRRPESETARAIAGLAEADLPTAASVLKRTRRSFVPALRARLVALIASERHRHRPA
jgi:hypothetical protein